MVQSKPHFTAEKMEARSGLPKVPHLVMVVCTKTMVVGIPGRILSNATCCLTLKVTKSKSKITFKNYHICSISEPQKMSQRWCQRRLGREQTPTAKMIYNKYNQNMTNLNMILNFIDFNNFNICMFKCGILESLARTQVVFLLHSSGKGTNSCWENIIK